ncbi:ion transporter [Flavobacteriaceae bacterium]|nr:ion transporter [Flavobacteriaceae bacterium]MDC0342255.1 ion transporter [Flavobacteriaceae bacterium]MDC1199114.1 ion transporter [Flavobacteriaceae bacterium]
MKKQLPAFFDKFIYVLIILNLISMVIESEPDLTVNTKSYLFYFEVLSISIFTLEYLIRSWFSIKQKKNYNITFFGIIDLLSILPFFFSTALGFDGRFVRIFRLFRVSRILKLGKFSKSFELLGDGIYNVKRELYITFFIAFIMLFFSASGIYYLENPEQPEAFSSITESFWWAVSSLTGVGFEEIFPKTIGGKLFGTLISLVGIGVVAVPTGIVSASFVEILEEQKSKP